MADEEKQSEGYVEFSKVTGNRIREDGEECWLVCEGPDGGQFDMMIPTGSIPDIQLMLTYVFQGAMVRLKSPVQPKRPRPAFVDAPPVFVATGLSGVVYPEAKRIDLQIETVNQSLLVSISFDHARGLFDFLLRVPGLVEEKSS